MSNQRAYTNIDEYIAQFPAEVQVVLQKIRTIIREEVPIASEKISYAIPAFALNGYNLVYFAGWKRHVSLYPIPKGSAEFAQTVEQYADGKGTLKFDLAQPLPEAFIREVVFWHVENNKLRVAVKQAKSRKNSNNTSYE
ncbi:MAG TPA: DUF1801 domain-containing protein [Anaerolineales bacterium]|nr:DUF1801 domain-containing protein [Anaerolineales bacterium]